MPSPSLEVVHPGTLTTVQDLGRRGAQRYGVPVSGAMDPELLALANTLVGNPPGAAGLECMGQGPTLRARRPVHLVVVGARAPVAVGRRAARLGEVFRLEAGETVHIGTPVGGIRTWVAVQGGVAVPPVLGSRSTCLSVGMGGLGGRALRAGDVLPVGETGELVAGRAVSSAWAETRAPARLRVLRGPAARELPPSVRRSLWETAWEVVAADRMGIRLRGGTWSLPDAWFRLPSVPVPLGAVQLLPGGELVILGADRQVTGGYPHVATVTATDVSGLAQLYPGCRVTLRPVGTRLARRLRAAAQRERAGALGAPYPPGTLRLRVGGQEFVVRVEPWV